MVVEGEPGWDRFLNAAEYVSDTFLPVSEVTQAAMPQRFQAGAAVSGVLADLYRTRMSEMLHEWHKAGFDPLAPDGGPYLVVPLPDLSIAEAERLALELVRDRGIRAPRQLLRSSLCSPGVHLCACASLAHQRGQTVLRENRLAGVRFLGLTYLRQQSLHLAAGLQVAGVRHADPRAQRQRRLLCTRRRAGRLRP